MNKNTRDFLENNIVFGILLRDILENGVRNFKVRVNFQIIEGKVYNQVLNMKNVIEKIEIVTKVYTIIGKNTLIGVVVIYENLHYPEMILLGFRIRVKLLLVRFSSILVKIVVLLGIIENGLKENDPIKLPNLKIYC